MKKALIYDPYLDTLGGGERYVLTFALGLIKNGYSIDLAWPDKNLLSTAKERFGFDLSAISTSPEAYGFCIKKTSLKDRYTFTSKYDLVFWVSDGSLPFLFSKNNLVHFQVPFKKIGGNKVINRLKSIYIHKFIYNSLFTRRIIEKNLPKDKGVVLYPPIDTASFSPGKKENFILSVARFDPSLTAKRQDILIEAFRKLSQKIPKYKLILAGGLKGDDTPVKKLKRQAKDLNVEILVGPDFEKLKDLYAKARFFWHTAGFGVDENENPEKVEHFGMTTVEAMSAGCAPIVIAKGGQKEIVTVDTGVLCQTPVQMATATARLILDPNACKKMSTRAVRKSKEYSQLNFYSKLSSLLK